MENSENKILSRSLTEEAAKNNELMHYFLVPETPMNNKPLNKKSKHPTIPETPNQMDNQSLNTGSPANRNEHEMSQTYRENVNQDNKIIDQMFNNIKKQMNQMNKVLKVMQLNKGDSDLHNCIGQVYNLLLEHNPHIMILNEINNYKNDNITKHSFPDYILETDNLERVDKRRMDLESPGISTVWIQMSSPGRKSLLLQGVYCQFQRLGVVNSDQLSKQEARWDNILEKWTLAAEEGKEILVLGDMNLNSMRWDTPMEQKTDYEKQQCPMILKLKLKIWEKGFKILNTGPTRTKDTIDSKPAYLDWIISNRLEKVAS